MKKTKLFSSIVLASVCGACLFAGCRSLNLDFLKPNEKEPQTTVRERTVSIADFETWETGFQLIRTGQFFGQIRVNKDAQFVKSGKQSAQIHAMGSYRSGSTPIMFFPTHSEYFGFDHSDFSDAQKVTFEFYNNEETPVNVAVGLVTSVTQILVFEKTAMEYQPLQTGWNTVTYDVNVSALSINADVTKIEGIYIAFENCKSSEEEDAPDLYLDDVVLHRYAEKQEVKNLVELEENEFADFESDWQNYVIGKRSTDCAPDFEIVTAADYKVGAAPADGEEDTRESLQATSGEKVLRFITKQGTGDNTFWPGVEFAPALLEQSLFGRLTEIEYGATTFSFDVYNNSATSFRFGIDFYTKDTRQRKEYIFYAEPYQWTTFSVNIKDLYEDFKAANKDKAGLFEQPGKLVVLWGEYSTGGDKEFFIDNMHFEQQEIDRTAKPVITLAPFLRVAKVGTKVAMPTYSVWDKYDVTAKATVKAYYKNGETWEDATVESGNVVIDKAGEYKLVASCTNSLGNESVQEYYFRGEESVKARTWASYDYADEIDAVHIDGEISDTNKKEWLEEFEGAQGVIKATTGNATKYGAGYLGFRFANQLLNEATETGWDYFTIRVYIEASASQINLYSWNKKMFDNVKTGEWIELKITKDMLNSGKTYVNRLANPVEDGVFYANFKEICGSAVGNLLYTTTIKNTAANSSVVYYIDEITWAKSENGSWGDLDDGVSDIYGDEWADPFKKENE